MADITLSSGSICKPYRSPWGAFPTRGMTISTGISSAVIHLGRVVTLDVNTTSNTSRILASTNVAGVVSSSRIVGVAAEAVSSNASTTAVDTVIPVWEANPLVEFSAATRGATLTSSLVGGTRALGWDSTLNITVVELANTTASVQRAHVTDLIDAVGDSGGRVAFRFMTRTYDHYDSSASSVTTVKRVLAFWGP